MVFSSSLFLTLFFPLFILVYFCLPKKASKTKNTVLLVASIFFYSWGAPKFIFVLLATTTLDFFLVKWMSSAINVHKQKVLLIISLSVNLGLLAYCKYSNFFIENFNDVLKNTGFEAVSWTKVILPIGISFYTFETITYVVDVFRKVHKPLDNFWEYQLYILLFPKLIAGPIVRFHSIADQVKVRNETNEKRIQGFVRFSIGLGKKILLANVLGSVADQFISISPDEMTSSEAWIGILAYAFQIYFDFSGYSDMALGIGLMLGFNFPENFNNPYVAQSITEYWRRWHISLGDWMRNYLYIPLGGNKGSKYKMFFNLWFVFLISGFWHGAAWNFIIWGGFHGLFLILDRLFLIKIFSKLGTFISVLFTFFIITIGWPLFRMDSFSSAIVFLNTMFSFNFSTVLLSSEFIFIFILAILFSFITLSKIGVKIEAYIYPGSKKESWYLPATIGSLLLFTLSLASISNANFNPFIYFRF